MTRSMILAAAVAAVALPSFAGTALAEPHRHPGHPGPGHRGHPGPGPGHRGHPRQPGPHHDIGPHRHPAFRPHPTIGPHRVFRGGRWVFVQLYPVGGGAPVYAGRARPAGAPAAGGCSTRRTASLTPYGWHKVVTVKTCITP